MCPACMATIAILAASAVSSGGLMALVTSKFRAKDGAKKPLESTNQEEETWEKQRTSK